MNEIKSFRLVNQNNKLLCQAFVVINFAPKDPLTSKDMLQVFSIQYDGGNFLAHLVNVIEKTFLEINDCYTLPATGMREGEWRRDWMRKNPDTTDDTKLAVYYYQKLYNNG